MFPVRLKLRHNPLISLEEDTRNPPIGPWLNKYVQGKWISKVISVSYSQITGDSILEIEIRFEDASDAMLFKLTWN